ncbi:MAG: hypothetical protein WC627_10430 [Legionella sp.]|jgi:hypothetical protein
MREDDYKTKKSQSLIKENQRLRWGGTEKPGGTHGSEGMFIKESSKHGRVAKPYFRAKRRHFREYFAFEILNAIGLSTPKARFVRNPKTDKVDIISKAIPHYMPLQAYSNYWPDSKLMKVTPEVKAVQRRYVFNAQSETVTDSKNKCAYKLSGNLFAVHIGGYLLDDPDLVAEGMNFGLVKEGDHFQAYIIDKDAASFVKGDSYADLVSLRICKAPFLDNDLYKEHTLHVVSNLKKLISPRDADQQPMLYDIFYNDRAASLYEYYLPIMVKSNFEWVLKQTQMPIDILDSQQALMTPISLSNSKTFMEIGGAIQKQFFNSSTLYPDKPLNTPERIAEYYQRIEQLLIESIREVLKLYPALTLGDLLKESKYCLSSLQDNGTYSITPYLLDTKKKVLNKNMEAQDFITQLFLMYGAMIRYDSMCENIAHNAELIIDHHANELKDYEERERIREGIVEHVFEQMQNKVDSPHLHIIRSRMLEDLRGPHYTILFKNHLTISAQDAANDLLLEKLYEDNYIELELDREPIKSKLIDYIRKIDPNAGENGVEFSKGYHFFVDRQSLNRRANFHLALRLLDDLDSGQSVEDLFSPSNLKAIRQEFFDQQGLGAKIESLNLVGWGIHSPDLNRIIKEARGLHEALAINKRSVNLGSV